jgi:outer membrane protein insertion porin family
VKVHSIIVHGGGAESTRESFLNAQLQPILSKDFHSLSSLIQSVDHVYNNLSSFDIYDKVGFTLDTVQENLIFPTTATSPQVIDLKGILHLTKAKRFLAKTGTDLGNGEGNGYANFTLNNVFGGAEILTFDATIGTRTRSSYLLNFSSPINNSAIWRGELLGYISSRTISWASNHDQILKGLTARIKNRNTNQELGLELLFRSVATTRDYVSPSLRDQLGNGIKSSLCHSWQYDSRDNSLLPIKGLHFKTSQEVAGILGSQNGDHPFIKASYELQTALPLPKFAGLSLNFSNRGGLLYMLDRNQPSHIMDRFFLGGPNDVRGFSQSGMGPRDEGDSIGGETFMASGISLISPLPWEKKDTPLRFQTFLNSGSLLMLGNDNTFSELFCKPSISTGFGLIYRHPVARFELNFTLPLVARRNEGIRKGLQFGVGLSFL